MEVVGVFEIGSSLSQISSSNSEALKFDPEARTAASSDLVESMMLARSNVASTASSHSPRFEELLEVMTHATAILCLDCSVEKQEVVQGRLDEQFLPGHQHSPPCEPFGLV